MLQAEAEPAKEGDFRIFDSKDTESTKEQSEGHHAFSSKLKCNCLRTKVVHQPWELHALWLWNDPMCFRKGSLVHLIYCKRGKGGGGGGRTRPWDIGQSSHSWVIKTQTRIQTCHLQLTARLPLLGARSVTENRPPVWKPLKQRTYSGVRASTWRLRVLRNVRCQTWTAGADGARAPPEPDTGPEPSHPRGREGGPRRRDPQVPTLRARGGGGARTPGLARSPNSPGAGGGEKRDLGLVLS